jgi:hypothetical protein
VIASGDNDAFGAPRFPFSGVAVAVDEREGVGVGGGGGVSLGSGFGEDFFFAFDDGDAPGDGETEFFLGDEVGEGDADSFFAVVDFFPFVWCRSWRRRGKNLFDFFTDGFFRG